jgi:hypothetical protein
MKNNKVLLLILATTFSPFLIAAILTTDYFSQQLEQKQFGEFLTTEFYLPSSTAAESNSLSDHSMLTTPQQWQLVISPAHKNYESFANKLSNIKTALGKRSDLVNVLSTDSINTQSLASTNTVYIATPKGQLLLAYRNDQVGKPLFKDLNHLLRSNN